MKLRITLTENVWWNAAERTAIQAAFGDQFFEKYKFYSYPIDLIVTANQLVAYQVIRDQAGGTNLWKQLKVRILDERCGQQVVVDVRPLCTR